MNQRYEQISNINFQVIDKPKKNMYSVDFDLDENNYNLKHFKTGFNYYKYSKMKNNEINSDIFFNTKLKNIKKDMKNLKNEIKKLNILAYRSKAKGINFYQRTINNNIEKNDINEIKYDNDYLYKSAKKRKIKKNDNLDYIYFSPDNKKQYTYKINHYKRIYNDNQELSNINLYKKKLQFNEINNNIIKKEKKNIKNKIEFNNQNVNHQIIIINNNNNNNSIKEQKQIKNIDINKKDDINKDNNNVNKEVKKEGENICLDKSLITDEELNIPLIIETLKYNKVILKNKDDEIQEFNKENNIALDKENEEEKKEEEKKEENEEKDINIKSENNKNILIDKNLNEDNLKLINQKEKQENKDNTEIIDIIKEEENKEIKNEIIEENNSQNKEDNINEIIINEINLNTSKDENKIQIEKEEENIIKEEENKIVNNEENEDNNNIKSQQNNQIELSNEEIISKILSRIQKPKKPQKGEHIQIKEDNNIIISFVPKDLITEYAIMKDSPELLDKTSPLNHSFSINQKILAQSLNLCPSIKNFKKEEIKIDNNYILREKMKEKDIIPGLYYENEEDIKNLEKSLEKSIDKSFDKSYDKSLNQSDVQNLTQSNNQSLSYNEGSLNASRNSNTDGNAIMQQLHKLLSGSILSTNVEVDEENLEENEEDISENKDEDKKDNEDEYISEKNEEQNESLSAGKPINEIEKENLNKSF